MKNKRIVLLACLFFLFAGVFSIQIGQATTYEEDIFRNLNVGYTSENANLRAYCELGVTYDTCKSRFYWNDAYTDAQNDADIFITPLTVRTLKWRNDAVLDYEYYSETAPKPSNYHDLWYSYSDNWCYRANGTILEVTTQCYRGDHSSYYRTYRHHVWH